MSARFDPISHLEGSIDTLTIADLHDIDDQLIILNSIDNAIRPLAYSIALRTR